MLRHLVYHLLNLPGTDLLFSLVLKETLVSSLSIHSCRIRDRAHFGHMHPQICLKQRSFLTLNSCPLSKVARFIEHVTFLHLLFFSCPEGWRQGELCAEERLSSCPESVAKTSVSPPFNSCQLTHRCSLTEIEKECSRRPSAQLFAYKVFSSMLRMPWVSQPTKLSHVSNSPTCPLIFTGLSITVKCLPFCPCSLLCSRALHLSSLYSSPSLLCPVFALSQTFLCCGSHTQHGTSLIPLGICCTVSGPKPYQLSQICILKIPTDVWHIKVGGCHSRFLSPRAGTISHFVHIFSWTSLCFFLCQKAL